MDTLFSELENSYPLRCTDPESALSAWREFAAAFPPRFDGLIPDAPFPSTKMAGEAGDLGLALLWIVQATLVRSFAGDIMAQADYSPPDTGRMPTEAIGALAHSENNKKPVIISYSGDFAFLNGHKKYITGGLHADLIFITAREKGEDKITTLTFIPRNLIPDESLQDLSMDILRSTSHASLSLVELKIPRDNVFRIDAGIMRKLLKRWSLVERNLILDSFIAVMFYIAHRLADMGVMDMGEVVKIQQLLQNRHAFTHSSVADAISGKRIGDNDGNIGNVLSLYKDISSIISGNGRRIPEDLLLRYHDLSLFEKIRT